MFVEEIRRAVQATPRCRLAELSAAVWKGFAAGAIAEQEAQSLAELIEARKVVPVATAGPARRVGSRPRSSASLERRRAWTGSGWLPPAIASRFTMGEAAAIGVIVAEIARSGRCELPIGAIAARAGVCATIVRNALRQARTLGLLHVETRRVARDRNRSNVVTIVSRELELWVRTRARIERQGGGCTLVLPTTNHILTCRSSRAWPLTVYAISGECTVLHSSEEANLSRYVLGLREKNGQTDQAVSYRTASKTVAEIEAWQAEGGVITVILRNGKAISEAMLHRDADQEQEPPDKRKRVVKRPSNAMAAAIAASRR